MFCSNCGGKIEEGVKFCSSCGKAVSSITNEPVIPTCSNCGKKLEDGVKFCSNCGKVVNTSSMPNTPPQPGTFGGFSPEQIRANQMAGQATQPYAAMQTNWQNQPQYTEPPKNKSTLLLIAMLVAPVILVIWATASIMQGYNGMSSIEKNRRGELESIINQGVSEKEAEQFLETFYFDFQNQMWRAVIILVFGLIFLSISTILIVLGQKKNSGNMILAAGIIYTVTLFGIPSAIICFFVFSKIKT